MKLEYVLVLVVVLVLLVVVVGVVMPAAQAEIAEALAPVQAVLEATPAP